MTNVPSLLSNYILIVDIWENLDQSFSLFNKVLTPNASESFLLDMGPLHVAEFLESQQTALIIASHNRVAIKKNELATTNYLLLYIFFQIKKENQKN